MANNTTLPGTGDVIRDLDRTGVKTQIIALDLNPAGAESLMAGVMPVSDNGGSLTVDGTVAVSGSVAVTGTFWQATQPVSATSLPLPTGASTEATLSSLNGKVTACNTGAVVLSSGTVTTVSTVTNLSQMGGAAISMGTGVRGTGTQRVTICTDDVVPASQSGTWTVGLSAAQTLATVTTVGTVTTLTQWNAGHGTAAAALRVELPTDGTGVVGLNAGSAIIGKVGIDQTTPGTTNGVVPTGNVAAGAADSGNPLKVGGKYNSSLPTLSSGQRGDAQLNASSVLLVDLQTRLDATNDAVAIGVKATGGATPYHLRAAASNNATALKASAGTLYGWHITNNNTTTCYRVKFYNKASAPSPGSDTPVYVLTIPAAASASQPTVVQESGQASGIAFGTGIAFAIVAGDSDTDNTAVTTLGDISLNLKYA